MTLEGTGGEAEALPLGMPLDPSETFPNPQLGNNTHPTVDTSVNSRPVAPPSRGGNAIHPTTNLSVDPRPVISPLPGGQLPPLCTPQGRQLPPPDPYNQMFSYSYTPQMFLYPPSYAYAHFTYPNTHYSYQTHPTMQGQYSAPAPAYISYPPFTARGELAAPARPVASHSEGPQVNNPNRDIAGPRFPVRNLDEELYEVRTKRSGKSSTARETGCAGRPRPEHPLNNPGGTRPVSTEGNKRKNVLNREGSLEPQVEGEDRRERSPQMRIPPAGETDGRLLCQGRSLVGTLNDPP